MSETQCLVCKGVSWQVYLVSREYPKFSYRRCKSCKFIQLVPIPTEEEIREYYCEAWSESHPRAYTKNYLLKQSLREKELKRIYAPFFSQIEGFLSSQGSRSLLDIGVGSGDFLRAAEVCGWTAWGAEISEKAAQFLIAHYGLKIKVGDFMALDMPKESFDFVHMGHSMEHMRDPGSSLEKAKFLLKTGGICSITVPTVDEKIFDWTSFIWKILYHLCFQWKGVFPYFWAFCFIAHISCYSAASLQKQLESHGFVVLSRKFSLPSINYRDGILRSLRSQLMAPLFLLSRSGFQVTMIAKKVI